MSVLSRLTAKQLGLTPRQRIAIRPGGRPQPVGIELWPTAYRFRRGHRLRLQVSSGAFPRWARNLGTGAPLATGSEMRSAEQSIHHSPACPSWVTLPICRRAA
jgi:predicted acyl esterase